jgi:hypothetical protein
MDKSKLSLSERTRPRVVAATRRRGGDDQAVTYAVSVAIALLLMVLATLAG